MRYHLIRYKTIPLVRANGTLILFPLVKRSHLPTHFICVFMNKASKNFPSRSSRFVHDSDGHFYLRKTLARDLDARALVVAVVSADVVCVAAHEVTETVRHEHGAHTRRHQLVDGAAQHTDLHQTLKDHALHTNTKG